MAELLRENLRTAIGRMRRNRSFVNSGSEWSMSQGTSKDPTGKITLMCNDALALGVFIRLMQDDGHDYARSARRNTIIITPRPE